MALFISARLIPAASFAPRSLARRASAALPVPSFRPPCRRLRAAPSSSSSAPSSTTLPPYYVTTPIYYVNDVPHIGHAYTSTACDVLARFARLEGRDVRLVTGTDEHGQKVQIAAEAAGVGTQEFVDRVSGNFRDMCGLLDISHDIFVRTTDAQHREAVQYLWRELAERGKIYLGSYEGWYSVRDECYYSEGELVEGRAPTGSEVVWTDQEESYFFRLSEYTDALLEHIERNPDFVAPRSRKNEVVSFLKGGLRDISISRTTFAWGVPVPDDPKHVMYVWIDALANYLSAVGYPDAGYEKYWPANVHVMGKDILRFHAVYWPAMLLAAGLPLPQRLFAHGWWTRDGQKISKSVGNVVDPVALVEEYGVDQVRFFLMSEVNFGNDGDFSDEAVVVRCNTNLANELGNLFQRTLSLAFKNCGAAVPAPGTLTSEDEAMLSTARNLHGVCTESFGEQAIHRYCGVLVSAARDANKYIDEQAPWALAKTDPERMATVLYVIMEALRHIGVLYQPVMPGSATRMLDQLGVPRDERAFACLETKPLVPGTPIAKPVGIFPRIDADLKK